MSLLLVNVLEVDTIHAQGKSERAPESWRPPSPRCLLALPARTNAKTQLLQATGLVAVSSGLLTLLNATRWNTGFGEPAKTASTATSPEAQRGEGGRQLSEARSNVP